MKKLIAAVCLAAMLLSVLGACANHSDVGGGSTSDTGNGNTTLEGDLTTPSSETSGDVTTAEPEIPELPDADRVTVSYDTPAICAEVGQKIDLAYYDVEFESGTVAKASELSWSSSDSLVEIESGRYVTVTKSGLYVLKAAFGKEKKNVYILAKEKEESEYVLYENDFSSMSGIMKIQETNGSATVSNGSLVLDAKSSASGYVRVLFPAFLADFSAYNVETSVKMTAAVNDKRWMSIMFNVQNSDCPYYQFAIRSNAAASNGVELAERTAENKWVVPYTGSFSSKLNATTEYKLKLVVNGAYAAGYINDKKIVEAGDFSAYQHGKIGLQANACRAEYSYVRITLNTEKVVLPTPSVDVRDFSSNINAPASMITEIKAKQDLDSILTNSPAAAILTVDSKLNILDASGAVICNAEKALELLDGKVIPVFRPKDSSAAEKIGEYTAEALVTDAFVISESADIIASARGKNVKMRAVLDFTAKKGLTPLEIRTQTSSAMANICLISSEDADAEKVNTIQALATVVWVKSDGDSVEDLVRCITSGAYGVLTADRITLEETLSGDIFAKNTVIRPIQTVGHRGMPSIAQENTIKGSWDAIEHGATIVENDVYITTDGVVVVMHDGTIDRTTNGTGNVEGMTYEQLSKYVVDSFSGAPAEPIPTLEDYMKEFKGEDVIIYIEIKSSKPEIVPAIKALIEKYDFYSQACVIAFSASQLKLVRTTIPEISCGYLSGGLKTLTPISNAVYEHASTFNPSHSIVNADLLTDLYHRGITLWPYTVNDSATFDKYYLWGLSGITTNYANFTENYIKMLTADKSEYSLNVNGSADVKLSAMTYKRTEKDTANAEMIIVSGNDKISFRDGKISATAAGNATVVFRQSFKLNNGQTVYVYTQPVTINVK